jgi:hypothetical protein
MGERPHRDGPPPRRGRRRTASRAAGHRHSPSRGDARTMWWDRFEFSGLPRRMVSTAGTQRTGAWATTARSRWSISMGSAVGQVHPWAVAYGPGVSNRAICVGIALLPQERGKGYGAQEAHARRLIVLDDDCGADRGRDRHRQTGGAAGTGEGGVPQRRCSSGSSVPRRHLV